MPVQPGTGAMPRGVRPAEIDAQPTERKDSFAPQTFTYNQESENKCGYGSWTPACLQICHNSRCLLVVMTLVNVATQLINIGWGIAVSTLGNIFVEC